MTERGEPADSIEAQLIAIALRHIRRDGLKRMTVVRIAEDAGMTHANVYRYFASKAAISERIVGDWLRGIEQRLNEISQAPDPADDKLERFITLLARAYLDKAGSDPEVFGIFADASEAETALAVRYRQRMRELLGRVIEEGMSTRVFSGADVRRMERLVLDTLHCFIDPHAVRMWVRRRAGQSQAGADARRDRVVRILLRGISSQRG